MTNVMVKIGGLLTTVQDNGRIGYQKYGITQAGVMDVESYRYANALVGNSPDAAVLEINYMGPELIFEEDTMIAVTGADCLLTINGEEVAMNESHLVPAGGSLRFVQMRKGVRSYLAFGGEIDVPEVNGSKSTFFKGHIGGFEGRQLKPKDILRLRSPKPFKKRVLAAEFKPTLSQDVTLRVVMGPQDDYFTDEGKKTFLGDSPYTVTKYADRMGYRLDGAEISFKEGADIISDGTAMGAIQVPKDGKPIILMADRQTTGGYTKIATVISADLPIVAQLAGNAKIHFVALSLEEAAEVGKRFREKIERAEQYLA